MTITIKKVVFQPHQEDVTFKDGKPGKKWIGLYTITDSELGDIPQATVETFAKTTDFITEGATLEATKREYKGAVSYQVKNPASAQASGSGWKGGSGGRQWTPPAKIPWAVYVKLCRNVHAEAKKIDPEHVTELFDRMLSNASVMLDIAALSPTPTAPPATPAPQAAPAKPTPATHEEADDNKKFLESGKDPWKSEETDDDSIL